jgi:hypothetical protein
MAQIMVGREHWEWRKNLVAEVTEEMTEAALAALSKNNVPAEQIEKALESLTKLVTKWSDQQFDYCPPEILWPCAMCRSGNSKSRTLCEECLSRAVVLEVNDDDEEE